MDDLVASPVHTTKDAHNKDYTTALPNTGIYDMNASTNKYTIVGWFWGDRKQFYSVHSPFFPPKKVEK